MGFWSKLGKIAGFAAPLVAAPFTGGASLAGKLIPAGLGVAGSLASGMEKGRAGENAAAENAAALAQRGVESNESAVQNRARLDLDRRELARKMLQEDYTNAIKGAYGKNVQDVSFNAPAGIPVVRFSGGARPSALGPEGRAAADLMNRQAMEHALKGEQFDALPAIERAAPAQYKKPGLAENLLGGAGAVGSVLDRLRAEDRGNQQSSMLQQLLASLQPAPKQTAPAPLPAPQYGSGGKGIFSDLFQ